MNFRRVYCMANMFLIANRLVNGSTVGRNVVIQLVLFICRPTATVYQGKGKSEEVRHYINYTRCFQRHFVRYERNSLSFPRLIRFFLYRGGEQVLNGQGRASSRSRRCAGGGFSRLVVVFLFRLQLQSLQGQVLFRTGERFFRFTTQR